MPPTLVWRTDVHLSDRTPRSRKDDWTETVLEKLRQVGQIAREVDACAVLDGGDFFDVKSPQRNSHALVRATAEVHKAYPCPVYANVGNHDCVYGDIEFLPQQPLGVLFATGIFQRLYNEHEAVFEQDGVKVRVVGIPYHGTKYDLSRFANLKKGDEDHLVVIGHQLASPAGGAMFEGEDIIKYADLMGLPASTFAFGHWHKDQGVTEIAPGQHIVNVGSLTRGSLHLDDLDRKPCCVVMKFTKQTVEYEVRPLQIQAPEVIFDLETRNRVTTRAAQMSTFVASLQATLQHTSTTPLQDIVRGMELETQVKERVLLLMEQ